MNAAIRNKIGQKTKPFGALGQLETLAAQICRVQQSLTPVLSKPTILVFAADHGIAQAGVSAYPAEVTAQMVLNFLAGGAAINVFSRQHGIDLRIIDAGVNYDFGDAAGLMNAKVGWGTRNFLTTAALTAEELDRCVAYGQTAVDEVAGDGCNVIGFGEMGIGNTSAASLIMHRLCGLPLRDCVGRGTGVDDEGYARKLNVLQRANDRVTGSLSPREVLLEFGGYEIGQLQAAMLAAYRAGMLLLVDGFIATAAFLCARAAEPDIIANAVFCHRSGERGHALLLDQLGGRPLLNLGLRLGEGTGCALAYPLLQSAVAFINEMASFDSAGVANKVTNETA